MASRKQARSSSKRAGSRAGAGSKGPRRKRGTKPKATRRVKPKATRRVKPKVARRPASKAARVTPLPRAGLGLAHHHMDYTTHVMDDVRRFYTEVLGLGPHGLDSRTGRFTVMTGAGSSLGFVPPLPGPPEQWRPPREPAIWLVVRDVDLAYRKLSGKGVAFVQEPTDLPNGQRVAILRDPEGRTVMLAKPAPR